MYLQLNDGGTLGTYNTNTSSFPWFIEMSGLWSFPTVNCNNLSVKNTKIKVINGSSAIFQVGVTTEQMIYLSYNLLNNWLLAVPFRYRRYNDIGVLIVIVLS